MATLEGAGGLTYTITGGADQALFGIAANTGVLTFNTAPDFENPTDADVDNVYEVEVTANDGNGGLTPQAISVTVTDAGLDSDLSTTEDNGSFTRSLTVRVNPLNDPPTLDAIPDQAAIDEGSPVQAVNLSGISAGGGESQQPLRVEAVATSNPELLTEVSVQYNAPEATGTLSYTAALHQSGTAVIEVTAASKISPKAIVAAVSTNTRAF